MVTLIYSPQLRPLPSQFCAILGLEEEPLTGKTLHPTLGLQ